MLAETLMEKTYSSSEIQRIAKITKIQAIHWTQTGVINPLQDAQGRGSRRVYSWGNLIEMMICRELNRYNVERVLMKDIIYDLNRPYSEFKNYWDFLKQNPKTDYLYLVISIMDESNAFFRFMQQKHDKDHSVKFMMRMRDNTELLKKLEDHMENAPVDENDEFTREGVVDEARALFRRNLLKGNRIAGQKAIVERKVLRVLTEDYHSCVVINIGALIEEVKKG